MTAIDGCQMYQIELPTTVLSADSNFNHLSNSAGMQQYNKVNFMPHYNFTNNKTVYEMLEIKFEFQHWMETVNYFYAYKIFVKRIF